MVGILDAFKGESMLAEEEQKAMQQAAAALSAQQGQAGGQAPPPQSTQQQQMPQPQQQGPLGVGALGNMGKPPMPRRKPAPLSELMNNQPTDEAPLSASAAVGKELGISSRADQEKEKQEEKRRWKLAANGSIADTLMRQLTGGEVSQEEKQALAAWGKQFGGQNTFFTNLNNANSSYQDSISGVDAQGQANAKIQSGRYKPIGNGNFFDTLSGKPVKLTPQEIMQMGAIESITGSKGAANKGQKGGEYIDTDGTRYFQTFDPSANGGVGKYAYQTSGGDVVDTLPKSVRSETADNAFNRVDAKSVQTFNEEANKHASTIQHANAIFGMMEAYPDMPTGPISQLKENYLKYSDALGIKMSDTDRKRIAARGATIGETTNLAMTYIQNTKGAITEKEMSLFMQAAGDPGKDNPATLKAKVAMARYLAERETERLSFIRRKMERDGMPQWRAEDEWKNVEIYKHQPEGEQRISEFTRMIEASSDPSQSMGTSTGTMGTPAYSGAIRFVDK